MKTVIALDSFKGCLSSIEACKAAKEGALEACPDAEVISFPLSDGGEGLTDILTHGLGGYFVNVNVHGPLLKPLTATYGIVEELDNDLDHSKTAIIEMAAACGLPLVPLEKRNPEHTTTFGFGEMIADALHKGCTRLILGIGGSATNDAGMGMLQALGASICFNDQYDAPYFKCGHKKMQIACGGALGHITKIDVSMVSAICQGISIIVASDVQNVLCGPKGAAIVFAPQKGADENAVRRLDLGLSHIINILNNPTSLPGDGAAGGLGFALRFFMHATLYPGIELVLHQIGFDSALKDADVVISGEGKSDAQTLMGKVPMGVLRHATRLAKPVYLIAGMIEDEPALLQGGFEAVYCINKGDYAPLSELMKKEHAFRNIKQTVKEILLRLYKCHKENNSTAKDSNCK